ncbi:MAG: hypothetical protein RLZZ283_410 [Candidatus Parcubacteria bacterium]|jgi:hypothetical protein
MEQEMHPIAGAILVTGVLHHGKSKLLSRRFAERNSAWMTAPYDGGGRVRSRNAKIRTLQAKIDRDLQESPNAAASKSVASRWGKFIRDFNREEKD